MNLYNTGLHDGSMRTADNLNQHNAILQMEAEVVAVVEASVAAVVALAQLQAMEVVVAVTELLLLAMVAAVTAMDVSPFCSML